MSNVKFSCVCWSWGAFVISVSGFGCGTLLVPYSNTSAACKTKYLAVRRLETDPNDRYMRSLLPENHNRGNVLL